MRVLMLGWEFPPNISGGLGTACQGLTRGLARAGVEVLFVVPREERGLPAQGAVANGRAERGWRLVGADRLAREVRARAADGPRKSRSLEILSVPSALRPYLDERSYAERERQRPPVARGLYGADLSAEVHRFAGSVASIARDARFDLIHAHDWMTWPAALCAKESSGRPLVCHVHALESDRSGRGGDPRIRALERLGTTGADRVVCVSRYTKERLRGGYGVPAGRLRVVHNGVESEELPREAAEASAPASAEAATIGGERPLTVLFLGRVTRQKGPEAFVEAARRVAREVRDARFVVAGDGDLLGPMVERVAALGLARRFSFTGFLDRAGVEDVLRRADVFVMPSVSEPFGIAPLEALAAGVPAIISNQSGVAEVLHHCLKVDSWDVEAMAQKIVTLLRRPRLRRRLAERGRAEVGGLGWERSARSMIRIYEELCA